MTPVTMPTTPHTRLANVISSLMRTPQLNFLLVADSSIWRPPLNMGSNAVRGFPRCQFTYRRNGCLGPGCLLRTVLHDCDARTRNVSVSATTIIPAAKQEGLYNNREYSRVHRRTGWGRDSTEFKLLAKQ